MTDERSLGRNGARGQDWPDGLEGKKAQERERAYLGKVSVRKARYGKVRYEMPTDQISPAMRMQSVGSMNRARQGKSGRYLPFFLASPREPAVVNTTRRHTESADPPRQERGISTGQFGEGAAVVVVHLRKLHIRSRAPLLRFLTVPTYIR